MTISGAKRILEKALSENGENDIIVAYLYDYYAVSKEKTERYIKCTEKAEHSGCVDERNYIIGEISLKSIIYRLDNGASLDNLCDERILSENGWGIGEVVRMVKLHKPFPKDAVPSLVKESYDDYLKYKEENKNRINSANERFLGLIKNFGYTGMI